MKTKNWLVLVAVSADRPLATIAIACCIVSILPSLIEWIVQDPLFTAAEMWSVIIFNAVYIGLFVVFPAGIILAFSVRTRPWALAVLAALGYLLSCVLWEEASNRVARHIWAPLQNRAVLTFVAMLGVSAFAFRALVIRRRKVGAKPVDGADYMTPIDSKIGCISDA